MNNFAEIIRVERLGKVVYYSISVNDEEALFDQFLEKHTIENNRKLNHILAWIRKLGNTIGALKFYFRNEAETSDASALPPIGIDREPTYVEFSEESGLDVNTSNNLRLYCFRVNDFVVFLFNGDLKTKQKAQDCPNVRPHFKMANTLTGLLNQAFVDKEICWNDDYTDILFANDYRLEWDN